MYSLVLLFISLQVAVCCICFFVILPLNLVGTILGRNLSGQPNFPCRVNAVPRPIPEKKWYGPGPFFRLVLSVSLWCSCFVSCAVWEESGYGGLSWAINPNKQSSHYFRERAPILCAAEQN